MKRSVDYQDHPLSIGQHSMWLIHECAQDKAIYNSHYVWKLPDNLSFPVLQKALEYIIERHPAFRTLFVPESNGVVQRIYNEFPLQLDTYDIPEMDDETLSKEVLDKELKRPFSLDREAPMRWVLISKPDGGRILGAFFHHIILDMGSFMVLANELKTIYGDLLHKREPSIPALDETFQEYILKQNDFLKSKEGIQQEKYWEKELQGIEASLDLTIDKVRPAQINCTTGYYNRYLPGDITADFNAFANENEISLFGLYIATYHLLIHKYTKQEDILIGTPTGGRGGAFKSVFGYFTNPVITRSVFDPDMSVKDFLISMAKKSMEAIKNQDVPLSRIAEKLKIDRDESKASLFQTSFVWQNINAFENWDKPMVTWDHSGKRFWDFGEAGTWERISRLQQLDDLDITFKVYKFKNDFHIGIEYNSDLFFPETIERLVGHFQELLKTISRNPDQTIAELSLLTVDEKEQVVNNWNNTKVS